MWLKETKNTAFAVLILLAAVFLLPDHSAGQDFSSNNYTVHDPVIDSGQASSSSLNFGLGQSLAQIAIGKSTSASFQLWSGFQYFFEVEANVLTATADDAEVDLAWTVPQTALGVNVAGYEVGTGTTSGTYTFEDVGNVTAFSKGGLANGTPYFFIIKAYAPGGTFLVFSNEDTATPNGVVVPPPSGGGGSGSIIGGQLSVTGTAYPNSTVTLLRDALVASTTTADASGSFTFTLNAQQAGTYTYGLYGTDANGISSPTVGFERTISNHVTTFINDVIVAPTIQASHTIVRQGSTVTVSGYTAASSPVIMTITGPQGQNLGLTSTPTGQYAYALNTVNLALGDYAVRVTATVNGLPSPQSYTIYFTIGLTDVLPQPGDCSLRSDLNCDGRVNLVDFSILLYFWDLTDFSRNPRADIDHSGDVELRDLSIMLYDWTG